MKRIYAHETLGILLRDRYQDDLSSYNTTRWVNPNQTNSKQEFPYSYSEFFISGSHETIRQPGVTAAYSDRLWQWDYDKATKLWAEHVGRNWQYAALSELSAFISAYEGKKLVAVALAEGCNPSTGYPYWILWYRAA
jgi:hypothetical protein